MSDELKLTEAELQELEHLESVDCLALKAWTGSDFHLRSDKVLIKLIAAARNWLDVERLIATGTDLEAIADTLKHPNWEPDGPAPTEHAQGDDCNCFGRREVFPLPPVGCPIHDKASPPAEAAPMGEKISRARLADTPDEIVEAFVRGYEFRFSGGGSHIPDTRDRAMLIDFGHGLVAEIEIAARERAEPSPQGIDVGDIDDILQRCEARDFDRLMSLHDLAQRQAAELNELKEAQKVWGNGFNWKEAFDSSQAERCRLAAELREKEQRISQIGDPIELQEAEQRGYARAQAEIERLREALKPFAAEADRVEPLYADNFGDIAPASYEVAITLGQCRAARSALSPRTKSDG